MLIVEKFRGCFLQTCFSSFSASTVSEFSGGCVTLISSFVLIPTKAAGPWLALVRESRGVGGCLLFESENPVFVCKHFIRDLFFCLQGMTSLYGTVGNSLLLSLI